MSQESIVNLPDGFAFVDAPPAPRNGAEHAAIAAALKANPGRWALILRGVNRSTAGNIKSGMIKAYPRGEFEARSNGTDAAADIYARYVGPQS
jgi:hypothetical protein